LTKLNDMNTALNCFEKVIALKPKCSEAHFYKGFILDQKNRFAEAIVCYDRVIQIKPDDEAYFNKGYNLDEFKDYFGAIEC